MYIKHEDHIELNGSAIPMDARNTDYLAYLAWVNAGNTPGAPAIDIKHQTALITSALQRVMDEKARSLGYDDLKTAITYKGDPNLKFAAEAEAFFVWRSAVWTQAYDYLAQVEQGEAQLPTEDQAIAMMPKLEMA